MTQSKTAAPSAQPAEQKTQYVNVLNYARTQLDVQLLSPPDEHGHVARRTVTLRRGINKIPKADWDLVSKMPTVALRIESEVLQVTKATRVPGALKAEMEREIKLAEMAELTGESPRRPEQNALYREILCNPPVVGAVSAELTFLEGEQAEAVKVTARDIFEEE